MWSTSGVSSKSRFLTFHDTFSVQKRKKCRRKERRISKVQKDSGTFSPEWIRDQVTERTNLLQFNLTRSVPAQCFIYNLMEQEEKVPLFVFPLTPAHFNTALDPQRMIRSAVGWTDTQFWKWLRSLTVCPLEKGSKLCATFKDATAGKGQNWESATK